MFISNGPYIIDVYKPENLYLKYIKFDKWVKPEFAEDMYNFEPYFDVIELYGIQNENTIILGVAKGRLRLILVFIPIIQVLRT